MQKRGQEVRVVDLERELEEDVLIAKIRLLETKSIRVQYALQAQCECSADLSVVNLPSL